MAITHINVISLPVTDQDRARDFYVNTLGFELVADTSMGPSLRWVQVGPQHGQASITLVNWFDTMPAGSVKGMVLETSDLDGDVAGLQARGSGSMGAFRWRRGAASSPSTTRTGMASSCRPARRLAPDQAGPAVRSAPAACSPGRVDRVQRAVSSATASSRRPERASSTSTAN